MAQQDKQKRVRKESERTLRMQELWLKAMQSPVVVECDSPAEANLIRFQLYNAVKRVRALPEANEELAKALEVVQISLRGDKKTVVRIGRSEASEKLDAALDKLGITGAGIRGKDDVQLEGEESARRFMERFGGMLPEDSGDGVL